MIDGKDAPSVKPGTPVEPPSPANPSPPLTRTQKFKAILHEVADKHEIPVELLLSKVRPQYVVRAKRELAYLIRKRTGWSVTIIARLTKTKDHTITRHRIIQHCAAHKLKLPKGITRGVVKESKWR